VEEGNQKQKGFFHLGLCTAEEIVEAANRTIILRQSSRWQTV